MLETLFFIYVSRHKGSTDVKHIVYVIIILLNRVPRDIYGETVIFCLKFTFILSQR